MEGYGVMMRGFRRFLELGWSRDKDEGEGLNCFLEFFLGTYF